jgi:salicylate hydroxylase
MGRRLKVAIVGAGLGGLFAAAALARRGFEVAVHERAETLGEVGAGIQVSPNAARLLRGVGALRRVERRAFQPEAAEMRLGVSGAPILRLPLGAAAEARWGAPYLQAHRADLIAALEETAREAGARILPGAEIVDARSEGGRAVLRDAGGGEIEADVAIGADGVRSTIRAALFGPERPRYTGQTAWRALAPADALPPALVRPTVTVWTGAGRHLVTYCLRRGNLINVVAVVERPVWDGEDWSTEGDPAALREAVAGWAPGATAPLAAVERCHLWGLFVRTAPPSWARGRVALLGDACHPMLPFMAQGAAQAFEDGAALARALSEAGDPAAALARYEAARRPRASRVQAVSHGNARLFHARGGLERLARYGPIAVGGRLAPGLAMQRLDWLYGHDAAA